MTQSGGFMDINDTGKLEVDFFFDPRCPYAYQSSLWMQEVAAAFGDDIDLRWKFFSLEQINRTDTSWNIWEQRPDECKSLWSFLVGVKVREKGGQKALGKYYCAVAGLFHEEGQDLNSREVLEKAATEAGVSPADLAGVFDGSDRSGYEILKADHDEACSRYNVFGVPTLVFEEKYAVFIKMMPKPASDKALEVFQRILVGTMVDSNIYELKRPMTAEQKEAQRAAIKAIRRSESNP